MLKLFILAVAIIGTATRCSSQMSAMKAMILAYRDTIGGAVSLDFHLKRLVNCGDEKVINTGCIGATSGPGAKATHCYICACGTAVPADTTGTLDKQHCERIAAPGEPAQNSWTNRAAVEPWANVTLLTVVPHQLYRVDDGLCYVSPIEAITGRTMHCFAQRFFK